MWLRAYIILTRYSYLYAFGLTTFKSIFLLFKRIQEELDTNSEEFREKGCTEVIYHGVSPPYCRRVPGLS